MTTVQTFKKSILFVVLYVVICDMTESTLPDFHCDSAGNVILENQDDLNKTEIVQPDGELCKPTQFNLSSDCLQEANTSIEIIFGAPVRSVENGSTIIGGLNSEYGKLSCKDTKVKVSATAKPFSVSNPQPSSITEKTLTMKYNITLSISGSSGTKGAQLGDNLTLSLEGPDIRHKLLPTECKAFPTDKPTNKHTIWKLPAGKTGKCFNEPSVIKQKWHTEVEYDTSVSANTTTKTTVSIVMYAFRFASSSSVTIECSAYVCPAADTSPECLKKCIDNKRRRRDIHGIHTSPTLNTTSTKIMVASTSFEVQLGDENQNTGNSAARLSKNLQLYSVTSILVLMVTMMIR